MGKLTPQTTESTTRKPRLRTAPSRLGSLPPLLGTLPAKAGSASTDRLRGRAGVARRSRIMLRDLFTCQLCRRVSPPKELRVDHTTPLAKGGSDTDDDNLRTLCIACHDEVTRDEFGYRRKRS